MNEPQSITVGELRQWLADYSDDTPIFFGIGDLSFYRIKNRGPVGKDMLQVEFNELYQVKPED